jgi:peptide-methionine (R)-S-oxide reductase
MENSIAVPKTEEEWKKKLTPEQYNIMRRKGTEMPFTGQYVHTNDKGRYVCAACGNQLFASDTKFDSGTGWPSFDRAIPGSIEMREDYDLGVLRVEVACAQCGAHLGHVFKDGPKDTTGERFCINSACLLLKKE